MFSFVIMIPGFVYWHETTPLLTLRGSADCWAIGFSLEETASKIVRGRVVGGWPRAVCAALQAKAGMCSRRAWGKTRQEPPPPRPATVSVVL